MIIAFGHRKQVGKDTCGQYLADFYNFERVAFADPLKQALSAMFGFDEKQLQGSDDDKNLVDPHWGFSPRHALQTLGEGARQLFGDDVWLRSAERRIVSSKKKNVVITDLRYPNEAEMIRKHGGILVRIDRPSLGPIVDQHHSENALKNYNFDRIVVNDGSLSSLKESIDRILQRMS